MNLFAAIFITCEIHYGTCECVFRMVLDVTAIFLDNCIFKKIAISG